jgi:hypothetical protein
MNDTSCQSLYRDLGHRYTGVGWMLCLVFSLASSWLPAHAGVQQTIYVSPTGSDSADGSIGHPLQTLAGAKARVATVNGSMTGDILVYFRAGTYPFSSAVSFGSSDSGSNGYTVYYEAYANEIPVFDGGVAVGGWTQYSGSIWVASLVRATTLRTLYVNGVRQTLARSAGIQTALGGTGSYSVTANGTWALDSGTTFSAIQLNSSGLPTTFSNQGDMEIVNQDGFSFHDVGLSAVTISGSTLTATLQQPIGAIALSIPQAWGSAFLNTGDLTANHFYLQNAFELMDQPGEFYFDRVNGKLYFDKPGSINLATAPVIAPLAEQIMVLSGTSTSSRVHDLSFSGFRIQHTGWSLLNVAGSWGATTVQSNALYSKYWSSGNWHTAVGPTGSSGYANTTVMPAAVEVRNGERIHFSGNTFNGLGAGALTLGNDAVSCEVIGNIFTDISGSAITVGTPYNTYIGDGDMATGVEGAPTSDTISDNVIDHAGAEFLQTIPIAAYYASGLQITHNEVSNAPYTGISMGWGFNAFYYEKPAGSKSTVAGNNSIDHNIVRNSMTSLHDGGAIYTLGAQPSSVVQNNLIQNTGGADAGNPIYTDQSSSGFDISNNIVDNYNGSWWTVWGSDAHVSSLNVHDNAITNVGLTESTLLSAGLTATTTTITDNRLGWPVTVPAVAAAAGLESSYRHLRLPSSGVSLGNAFEAEDGTPLGRAIVQPDTAASAGQVMAQLDLVGDGVSFSAVPQADAIAIRYASALTGHIGLYVNGTRQGSIAFASTGGWFTNYGTVSLAMAVPAGATVSVRNDTGDSGLNLDTITFLRNTSRFIEAEAGTTGGRAIVCAVDSTAYDQAAVCQLDQVGDSLSFVSPDARTSISLRYAAAAGGVISVYVDGTDVGDISFGATGGWFSGWTRATLTTPVPAGATIKIQNDSGDTGFNLDSIRLD